VPGIARTSTIAAEKAANPLLAVPDVDTFVARLLEPLGSYPGYFRRLGEVNRRGPAVIAGAPSLPGLSVDEVRRAVADGAVIVDVRPVADVAAGHIPGAVAIPLRAQFATWLGWLTDPGTPMVIVRNPEQDPADILWPALNIGVDALLGELSGGIAAWTAAGGDLVTTALVAPDAVDGTVLDIRQNREFATGHLPSALHIELGDLATHADQVDRRPTVVMCGHGERAMTAATLLQRAGHRAVSVLDGGAQDWAKVTGHDLAQQ
jgi:rhodanese-related sulfurtransferase